MTGPCEKPVDLIDNIHQDLGVIRGVICLLEATAAGSCDYFGAEVLPLLGSTRDTAERVKANANKLWELAHVKQPETNTE